MEYNNNYWLIILVIVTLIYFVYSQGLFTSYETNETNETKLKEHLILGPGLRQYARIGRFDNDYFIGVSPVRNLSDCKNVCNNMESCEGISYNSNRQPPECRLYSSVGVMMPDMDYLSWRKFGGVNSYSKGKIY